MWVTLDSVSSRPIGTLVDGVGGISEFIPPPWKCIFPLGDLVPHECVYFPKQRRDRFSRFYTAHGCVQYTYTQIIQRATSVAVARIYALNAGDAAQ